MSSRNVRLTPTHRAAAVRISEVILLVKEVCELALINATPKESRHMKGMIKEAIQNSGGIVDYVDIVEQRSLVPVWKGGVIPNVPQVILVAAKYGDVRLLDNVELFGEAD
jgi:pantoate--beta-alanine ligase